MTSKTETAIRGIRRHFLGGFRTRTPKAAEKPKMGAKERARHAGKPDGVMK